MEDGLRDQCVSLGARMIHTWAIDRHMRRVSAAHLISSGADTVQQNVSMEARVMGFRKCSQIDRSVPLP